MSVALYMQNRTAVDSLIQHYKQELVTRALTLTVDWASVITRFVASATAMFHSLPGDPAQRKDAVIAAFEQFYADVLSPIVATAVGRPLLFNTFVNPAIERMIPNLIGGLYDTIVRVISGGGLGGIDAQGTQGTQSTPALPQAPGEQGTTPALPGLPDGFVPY